VVIALIVTPEGFPLGYEVILDGIANSEVIKALPIMSRASAMD
jgi:hypothetical protein